MISALVLGINLSETGTLTITYALWIYCSETKNKYIKSLDHEIEADVVVECIYNDDLISEKTDLHDTMIESYK